MRAFATLLVLILAAATPACPLCKDSVPNDEGSSAPLKSNYNSNGENISGGINRSIFIMFGGLFGTMGLIGAIVYRSLRHTAPAAQPPKVGTADERG